MSYFSLMVSEKIGIPLFLVLPLMLTSCTGVKEYYISRPQAVPRDGSVTKDGAMSISGVKLNIRPTNLVVSASGIAVPFVNLTDKIDPKQYSLRSPYYNYELLNERPSVFYMEILLSTNVPNTSFDPKKVTLIMSEGVRLQPSAYIGPMEIWSKANYGLPLCRKGSASQEKLPASFVLIPNKNYCVAIGFNVSPPLPNTGFSITINGLSVNEQELAMPVVTYETKMEEFYYH